MTEDPTLDEWLEIEGRSKSDAIERACVALNTTAAYLEFEILGNSGSKIRARKLEKPKEEELSVVPTDEKTEPEEELQAIEKTESEVLLETPTETGNNAKDLLEQVLKFIDTDVQVELAETGEEIRLNILGNGSGLLIGKHGQTLEALQHLVAKMSGLDRRSGKRLMIDSEHYRSRRQEALEGLARKLASRARRENRPISVEPMNAVDRRILHLALQNDRNVMTKSVGEGSSRKVVVLPRGYEGSLDRVPSDSRGGQRGQRGPRRNNNDDKRKGPRASQERSPRRRSAQPSRMHDSFDAPPVPEHDLFQDDDDLLKAGLEMDEADPETSSGDDPQK